MSKNVVVIGGGTGVFTVLTGLKEYPHDLSAIVSMADDGGSTGVLREEFGVLPPGDIRRALIALSTTDNKILSELFNFRFDEGSSLKGHSLGNLLLASLEKITGSFDKAVAQAVKILNVKGKVIPVTLKNTKLFAELEDGSIISGETNIDIPKHNGNLKIKRIYLDPKVEANSHAIRAIKNADMIIIGPGDLYTSIIPNLLVADVADAIQNSKAKVCYIVNIMTKFGETNDYEASSFVKVVEGYIGQGRINYCVINTQRPVGNVLKRYLLERDEIVRFDKKNFNPEMNVITGRFLRRGQFLRHDPKKLAAALSEIIDGK